MMHHLASAQYWDWPACENTGRLFLTFGGPVCADRISNCPLDRALTYKNLIYFLNFQLSLRAIKVPLLTYSLYGFLPDSNVTKLQKFYFLLTLSFSFFLRLFVFVYKKFQLFV